jgi:hypothetical protein
MRLPQSEINQSSLDNIFKKLSAGIDAIFGVECYLAVLFKNTKKCEALVANLDGVELPQPKRRKKVESGLESGEA